MHYIHVEGVSLTFPLYQRTAGNTDNSAAYEDKRLIYDKNGSILGVRALRKISFSVVGGERIALIGKNGSGKTTLLQAIAGILPPDEGRIELRGQATNLINLHLGMRAEATGNRNITLKGLAAGHTHAQIEARRSDIADFSELGRFLDMPVETYSAGMRMRLSFAIATAFHPEILILDEWISAGDTAFKRKASKRMREFVGNAGILILASHSRNLLLDNCTRGIWLDGGQICADGDVKSVLDAYEARIGDDYGLRDAIS